MNQQHDSASVKKQKSYILLSVKLAAIGFGLMAAAGTAGIIYYLAAGKKKQVHMQDTVFGTVENLKASVQDHADTVKDSAAQAARFIHDGIKDVADKAENVQKDIKGSRHEIVRDIQKAADHISDDLK